MPLQRLSSLLGSLVLGGLLIAAVGCTGLSPEDQASPGEPTASEEPSSPGDAVAEAAPGGDPVAFETQPVATLDGQALSLERFNGRYRARMPALRNRLRGAEASIAVRLKRAVLSELIDETLLEREARRRGASVSDGELDRAVDQFRRDFEDEASYRRALDEAGGPAELRRQIAQALLRRELAGEAPAPTDADVAAAYRQSAHLWRRPAHLLADEIALTKTPEARARLEALRARLLAEGLSFRHHLRMHPELGGRDLGEVTAESVDALRWSALDALDVGEISPVIETEEAFVLLHLRGRVEARSVPLDEAATEIRRELLQRRQAAREAELLIALRAAADIDNHLEARYADLFEPTAEPTRAGIGFASVKDQLPATLASSDGRSGAPR